MGIFSNKKLEVADTLSYLFDLLGVKVSYSTISLRLQKHPDFPSAKSLSDILNNFNVRNKATVVDLKTLQDIQAPFLATTFDFKTLVINSIENNVVSFYSSKKGLQTESIDLFQKKWNGLVILVDTEADYIEKDYKNIRRKEFFQSLKKFFVVALLIMSMLLLYCLNPKPVEVYFYLFIKILGVVITTVLLAKSIDKNMKVKFCETGDKASCNDVLDSKAANLMGVIPMADIGFAYFIGSLIAVTISLIRYNDTTILYQLNILSFFTFLYVPFSLFYQKFIVKKWCVLCLGVLSVITFENIAGFYLFNSLKVTNLLTLDSLLLVALSFLIPAMLLFIFKQLVSNGLKYDAVFYHRSRLLNNYAVFESIQEKNKSEETLPSKYDLVLGLSEAKHTLTVVVNPFCSACADEYDKIIELLGKKPKMYNATIRFSRKVLLKNDLSQKAATHLIDLYHNEGKNKFQNIMMDWFTSRELQGFVKKYPVNKHDLTEKTIQNNKNWNDKVKIAITPTLYFNNHKMSDHYAIEDLEYFDLNN